MGRGRFTEEEQEILKGNKHVILVTDKAIYYTNEFKLLFIKEYLGGKKPAQIFQDAGFDLKMLGSKRFRRKHRNHLTMIIRGHWSNAAMCRRT